MPLSTLFPDETRPWTTSALRPSQLLAPPSSFTTITKPATRILLDTSTLLSASPSWVLPAKSTPTSLPPEHAHSHSNTHPFSALQHQPSKLDASTTPSSPTLQPYQIFLIVFFGLASIPVSMAVFWCIGSLRKRSFNHADEWSSSLWKRRPRPPPPPPPQPTQLEKLRRRSSATDVVGGAVRRLSGVFGPIFGFEAQTRRDGGRLSGIPEENEHQQGNGSVEQGVSAEIGHLGGRDVRADELDERAHRSPVWNRGRPGPAQRAEFVVQETEVGRAWARPRAMEDEPEGWRVVTVPAPASVPAAGRSKGWNKFRAETVPHNK